MRSARKFKPYDTIYNGDRWRVPGRKDVYFVTVRNFNGVNHWELYHYDPTTKKTGLELFALQNSFAVQFKKLYNASNMKKIRTPVKDRVGPYVALVGLTH